MAPPSSRTTIYDVADAAGVAISTVSRVLNGSTEVADQTRQKVQDAIDRLNFRPHRTARSLASQEAMGLVVAMPSFTSLFYVEILKGIKDVLRERGDTELLLCNLGSLNPDTSLLRFLERGAVGGLLLVSLPPDQTLHRELEQMQAPVVLLGARDEAFDSIWWNDAEGAALAVRHLIEAGHTRIGLITAHPWSQSAQPRLEGYRKALEEAGLPFDSSLVARGDTQKHAGYSEEAGAEGMQKLMALSDPPTAVFAASDVQAYGAWAHARTAGLRVPKDVSIMGYDDLKLSRFLGLTTIEQKMQDVGAMAAERILSRMSTPRQPLLDHEVTVSLNERDSVAAKK